MGRRTEEGRPTSGRAPRWWSPVVTLLVASAAAGFAVFALLRLFGLERGFPLVPLLAYTPYVLVAALPAVVGAALLRRWYPTAVLAVAVVVLAVAVVPRTVTHGITDAGGPEIRVMTLNALGGGARVSEVVGLVRDREVDVLALQEVTPGLVADLSAAGLDDLLPHVADHSDPRGVHGSTVHSVFPLTDLGSATEDESAFAMPTAALEVPGYEAPVEVTSVHVLPPLNSSYVADWRRELRTLADTPEPGTTRVLAGDFNATLDHAEMRAVLDAGYVDAASVQGEGLDATWPMSGSLPGVTIDHVLVGSGTGVGGLEVLEVTGTDHRAVLAEVTLFENR